jgi:aspartate kinase
VSESTVLKFGGTSVADAAALLRVAGVVQRAQRTTRPIVVVSALAGVTDALLAAADAAASGDVQPQLAALLERHAEIAGRLARPDSSRGIQAVLGRAHAELADLLRRVAGEPERRPALRDEIVSYGERLSAALLTAVLLAADVPARYVDARHCLITDGTHGWATPLLPDTE